MKRWALAMAAASTLAGTGCLYAGVTLPQSYFSPTEPLKGAAPDAHGEACAFEILWLVALGDAGYDTAYKTALATSGAPSLYDIRVDRTVTMILGGLYAKTCTELTGRVPH